MFKASPENNFEKEFVEILNLRHSEPYKIRDSFNKENSNVNQDTTKIDSLYYVVLAKEQKKIEEKINSIKNDFISYFPIIASNGYVTILNYLDKEIALYFYPLEKMVNVITIYF